MSTCRWLHLDLPGKNELGPNGKISTAQSVRNWAKRIGGIARTGGVYPRPKRTPIHFICGRLYKNELRMSYLGVYTIPTPSLHVTYFHYSVACCMLLVACFAFRVGSSHHALCINPVISHHHITMRHPLHRQSHPSFILIFRSVQTVQSATATCLAH